MELKISYFNDLAIVYIYQIELFVMHYKMFHKPEGCIEGLYEIPF